MKTILLAGLAVCLTAVGCGSKDTVTLEQSLNRVELTRRSKAAWTPAETVLDSFNKRNLTESTRKKSLTQFGRLTTMPPARQYTFDDITEAVNTTDFHAVQVAMFETERIHHSKFPFDYENNVTALKNIYKSHNLDEILDNKKTTLDELKSLMVYVNERFSSKPLIENDSYIKSSSPDPTVLERYAKSKGISPDGRFQAFLFCQLAQSTGLNARVVSVHTFDDNGKLFRNHVSEVFLDRYKKWVAFDPTHRATYYSRDGIPLSVLEIRRLMLENRFDEIVTHPQIGNNFQFIDVREDLLPCYQFVCLWRMNDFISMSRGGNFTWKDLYPSHLVWDDAYAPVSEGRYNELPEFAGVELKYITKDQRDYYWDINLVHIDVERITENEIKLYIDTVTPNFSHFDLLEDVNVKRLNKNVETFDIFFNGVIVAVNKFGVKTPPAALYISL